VKRQYPVLWCWFVHYAMDMMQFSASDDGGDR
jgi:hypothetical protein